MTRDEHFDELLRGLERAAPPPPPSAFDRAAAWANVSRRIGGARRRVAWWVWLVPGGLALAVLALATVGAAPLAALPLPVPPASIEASVPGPQAASATSTAVSGPAAPPQGLAADAAAADPGRVSSRPRSSRSASNGLPASDRPFAPAASRPLTPATPLVASAPARPALPPPPAETDAVGDAQGSSHPARTLSPVDSTTAERVLAEAQPITPTTPRIDRARESTAREPSMLGPLGGLAIEPLTRTGDLPLVVPAPRFPTATPGDDVRWSPSLELEYLRGFRQNATRLGLQSAYALGLGTVRASVATRSGLYVAYAERTYAPMSSPEAAGLGTSFDPAADGGTLAELADELGAARVAIALPPGRHYRERALRLRAHHQWALGGRRAWWVGPQLTAELPLGARPAGDAATRPTLGLGGSVLFRPAALRGLGVEAVIAHDGLRRFGPELDGLLAPREWAAGLRLSYSLR